MIDLVIEARRALITPGMEVKRILPFRLKRMVGPFIFMDHAGPVDLNAMTTAQLDVLPHPHIGLSTVSYLLAGEVTHRDSLGVEQIIRPGEVNWMTAGRGIAHSERFEAPTLLAQGKLEMLQTWVALPERDEESAPTFDNYKPEDLPVYTDKGVWMRLIAGDAYGLRGNVKTHSPLFYLHAQLDKGTRFGLPSEHSERAIYVVTGQIEIVGRTYGAGQMLVFGAGNDPVLLAVETTTIMLLGGEPLGERFICRAAGAVELRFLPQGAHRTGKRRLEAGPNPATPNDNDVFIPLPDDRSRPAGNPAPQALS